jgi:Mce-associated membrane protein
MSDDDLDPTDSAEPTGAPPARRSSPSAHAASRARRIGGRPLPGPRRSIETAEPEAKPAGKPGRAEPKPKVKPAKRRRSAEAAPRGRAREADAEALRRQLARLRWIPTALAGVLVAVLLGLCVWQSHGVWWAKTSTADARNKARTQVLAAAKTCVAAIASYDYHDLAKSEAAGKACTTGNFQNDYTKSMETVVSVTAPQTKAVVAFETTKAGIVSVSDDGRQWVVLVFGQQNVNNTNVKDGPRVDLQTVRATLDKVGGQWLVSALV